MRATMSLKSAAKTENNVKCARAIALIATLKLARLKQEVIGVPGRFMTAIHAALTTMGT